MTKTLSAHKIPNKTKNQVLDSITNIQQSNTAFLINLSENKTIYNKIDNSKAQTQANKEQDLYRLDLKSTAHQ